jgi:ribose 5-phosphate isomerase A
VHDGLAHFRPIETKFVSQYMLCRMSVQKGREELEEEKRAAARAALWWVRSGMTLGLGSGSTAHYFIALLGEQVRRGSLDVAGIASSSESERIASEAGITLTEPRRGLHLDLAVDGADEIAPDLNLIKGGGGALLREKALAEAARYFLVIADSSKRVAQLGAFPLPVEVVPFTLPWVMDRIQDLGAEVVLRVGEGYLPQRPLPGPAAPYLTDQGNYVLDCRFGKIENPRALAARLREVPGVVEHGIFLSDAIPNRVLVALVAEGEDVLVLRPGATAMALPDFKKNQELRPA